MAKRAATKGMHGGKDKKTKGRTAITATPGITPTTTPNVEQTLRVDANRPISGGGGNKHRGDRRDMSKTYTGNARHSSRGNNPRTDVKTRAR